jgi:hypothetical protein
MNSILGILLKIGIHTRIFRLACGSKCDEHATNTANENFAGKVKKTLCMVALSQKQAAT